MENVLTQMVHKYQGTRLKGGQKLTSPNTFSYFLGNQVMNVNIKIPCRNQGALALYIIPTPKHTNRDNLNNFQSQKQQFYLMVSFGSARGHQNKYS